MTGKVTIRKAHDIGNKKLVLIDIGYADPIPATLRGMELCLHSSTGSMADRMRAAQTIKRVIERHYGV